MAIAAVAEATGAWWRGAVGGYSDGRRAEIKTGAATRAAAVAAAHHTILRTKGVMGMLH